MSSTTDLVTKLRAWLLQQPEYAALLAGSRRDRRIAARLLSAALFTIPTRDDIHPVGREAQRKLVRVFKAEVRKPPAKSKRARADYAMAWKMYRREMARRAKAERELSTWLEQQPEEVHSERETG